MSVFPPDQNASPSVPFIGAVACAWSEEQVQREYVRGLRRRESMLNRRQFVVAIMVTVILNVLLVIGLRLNMRVPFEPVEHAIAVRLIEENSPSVPVEPNIELIVPPPSVSVQTNVPQKKPTQSHTPRTDGMSARIKNDSAPAPQLFNADGSVRLPQMQEPARTVTPQEQGKALWADLTQRGENPLDCQRTRFAQAYRRDESVGDEVARKYLRWIGLADPQAINHRASRREARAAEGCNPASSQ